MKKIIFNILLFLIPFIGSSQGDCPDDATVIDKCGTSFTINNSSMEQCGQKCGTDNSACGTKKNGTVNYSNYDGDCSTECAGCSSGGSKRIGCDINGSTENNAFWTFTPTETCDYEVTIDVYNCNNGNGIQYGIWEYVGGSFTTTFASSGSASTSPTTITESFTATNGNPVLIMIDGYAGDVCDISVSVSAINCSGCTLPIKLKSFNGENINHKYNKITWVTATEKNNDYFELQRMNSNGSWTTINITEGNVNSQSERYYQYKDYTYDVGVNYYRLKQFDIDGESETFKTISIENKKESTQEPIKVINIYGQEVRKDYTGPKILIYENGKTEKIY